MRLLATGCSHPCSSASDSSPMASSAWHQMKPHCLHQLIYQTLISSWPRRARSLPCTNQPSFLTSLICELQLQHYDTLTKHRLIHFQYMKICATMAEDLTRHSLLPMFRANWTPLHDTERSQGFELFHLALDQEKLQVQCSIDSWALQLPVEMPSPVWRASFSSKTICKTSSGCCN